jgi:hypothetical protein
MSHGIAALTSVIGWNESCQHFKECIILADEEKQKMADVARPAWKEWITTDFGVDPVLVDGLWAEVARIAADQKAHDQALFAN